MGHWRGDEASEWTGEEECAGCRSRVIGTGFPESEALVKRLRFGHSREGIEADLAITPGLG